MSATTDDTTTGTADSDDAEETSAGSTSASRTNDDGLTPLVRGLKNDKPEDSRSCSHDDCHGNLDVTDEDRARCQSCYCTPDGAFLPPDDRSNGAISNGLCSQTTWFNDSDGTPSSGVEPHPSRGEEGDEERYSHSNKVILPGGHEMVYDKTHHRGGTAEYTFDISSL